MVWKAAGVWDPTSVSLMGIGVVELALAVLGVMMVSAEYPTGLIWLTLAAVPRRVGSWPPRRQCSPSGAWWSANC